eukprot:6176720-Pleurochrysis_carterae.AAC.4
MMNARSVWRGEGVGELPQSCYACSRMWISSAVRGSHRELYDDDVERLLKSELLAVELRSRLTKYKEVRMIDETHAHT